MGGEHIYFILNELYSMTIIYGSHQALMTSIDALPSPGVNPLEGSPKCS